MDAIKTLEDVISKTTKNTSKENRERAVKALLSLFSETSDIKQIIGYIMKLHYSVCQAFFEELCSSSENNIITAFAEALISNEQFRRGNTSNNMYPKGLSAVSALVSKGKYEASFLILKRILMEAEKNGYFSECCINNFNKLIVGQNQMSSILNLQERITEGKIVCEEHEKNRLFRFLRALDNKVVVTSVTSKEEVHTTSDCKATQPGSDAVNQGSNQKQKKEPEIPEAIKKIASTQQEILAGIRKLLMHQSTIESLSNAIAQRDKELAVAKAELVEKENHKISLEAEIVIKNKKITELETQINDLTERLRTSFQMDEISKNQELLTLKNNISEALKLEYEDYIKSKDQPYNDDLLQAYRSTLGRIFKLLKRFGIDCQ